MEGVRHHPIVILQIHSGMENKSIVMHMENDKNGGLAINCERGWQIKYESIIHSHVFLCLCAIEM